MAYAHLISRKVQYFLLRESLHLDRLFPLALLLHMLIWVSSSGCSVPVTAPTQLSWSRSGKRLNENYISTGAYFIFQNMFLFLSLFNGNNYPPEECAAPAAVSR